MKPARDHQVQHEKEVVIQLEDDPLSEAAKPPDPSSLRRGDGRIERAQEKRARDPHAEEWLSDDAGLESRQVRDDVGKLRHRGENSRETADGVGP